MEELLVKLKKWKRRDGKERLSDKNGKTQMIVSSVQSGPAGKFGKDPFGVSQTGVRNGTIFCGGCLSWTHKNCSGIKSTLCPDPDFRCARCLGKARPIDGKLEKEVQVGNEKVVTVPECRCLGNMLNAGIDFELAAVKLC